MLRHFYTFIFLLALPMIFARLWWKEKRVPGYRIRWAQRLGVFKTLNAPRPVVWIHAVSVGEVIAASELIRRLIHDGSITLMVTTMTPTGSARVTAAFGAQVAHVYAPFDLPWTVTAFIKRTRPILTIIMETEIWPNMLVGCAKHNVPAILANARLSSRSARRYGWFPATTKALLNRFARIAVQNAVDAERFVKLGLAPDKLSVIGSVKFDLTVSSALRESAAKLKQCYSAGGERKVLIAASTHQGEELQIAEVYQRLRRSRKDLLLVVVPRHPERFDEIHQLFAERFVAVRRSGPRAPDATTEVVIGDTMGELMLLYGAADIAFVGGSLIERGGHNMIEPAAWGLPVLSGPHIFNFNEISKGLIAVAAMRTVHNVEEFEREVRLLLEQPQLLQAMGAAAKAFVDDNRGALNRLMAIVAAYLPPRR